MSTLVNDGSAISDADFSRFQRLIHGLTGIHLAETKKPLLCGRLAKRLRLLGISGYREYYELVARKDNEAEREICINLITTNETYFFRESNHFDYLVANVLPMYRRKPLRLWSAACSSGEEPYTLALVLAEQLGLGGQWEILGSDISTDVLRRAAQGLYTLDRGRKIPQPILKKYCLKGVGEMDGYFKISPSLQRHVGFAQINLNEPLPDVGLFDIIFLRNVMIYFQPDVKAAVIERLATRLRPGGWLFIGHSETLSGITDAVRQVAPTVYRKSE